MELKLIFLSRGLFCWYWCPEEAGSLSVEKTANWISSLPGKGVSHCQGGEALCCDARRNRK